MYHKKLYRLGVGENTKWRSLLFFKMENSGGCAIVISSKESAGVSDSWYCAFLHRIPVNGVNRRS